MLDPSFMFISEEPTQQQKPDFLFVCLEIQDAKEGSILYLQLFH